MAVMIRLARHGRRKRPFYRMVVADKQMPRDGRFLELVGTVNPLTDPSTINLKNDRIKHWLSMGARASDTAAKIIEGEMPGTISELEKSQTEGIRSRRAKRRAKNKGVRREASEAKQKKKDSRKQAAVKLEAKQAEEAKKKAAEAEVAA